MLKKLTDRIYYMPQEPETDRPSLGLIIGDKYSLMIDSGTSPKHAKEFLNLIKDTGHTPLKYIVLTHWHTDHIFGIATLNLIAIANYKTEEKLRELREQQWDDETLEELVKSNVYNKFNIDCLKTEMPLKSERVIGNCDLLFKEGIEIDLGGIKCVIDNLGGSHTDDSTVIYIPEEKVLFLGDIIYGKRYDGEYGYTRETLYPMIERIKQYDADFWIVSHEYFEKKEEIEAFFDQLIDIAELVGENIDADAVVQSFTMEKGKEPSEDERSYIEWFANVNKVRGKK